MTEHEGGYHSVRRKRTGWSLLRSFLALPLSSLIGLVVFSFGAGWLLKLSGVGAKDAYAIGAEATVSKLAMAKDWLINNFDWAGEYTLMGAMLVLPIYFIARFIGLFSRSQGDH